MFLLAAVGITALWYEMESQERNRVHLETQVTTKQMRLRLEAWIDARMATVGHLASSHARVHGNGGEGFRPTAQEFLTQFKGFQALNWVSPEGTIEQVVPLEGNEAALGRNLFEHPDASVREALQEAIRTRSVTRTQVVDLLQGGKGMAAYWPAYDEEERLVGFVNAVFRIQVLLDDCFSEERLNEEFVYRFEDTGGEVAYTAGTWESDAEGANYEYESRVRVIDRPWILRVRPSAKLLAMAKTSTDEFLLILGLLLAFVVMLLLRAIILRQQKLRSSEGQIRLLLDSTGEAILGVDAEGRCTFSNPACAEALGFDRPARLTGRDVHELLHRPDTGAAQCSAQPCPLASIARTPEELKLKETHLARNDGTSFIAELSAYPIRHGEKSEGAVIIFEDRTERIEMEEALRRREELFRAITENSSAITLILSRAGRYKYVSPSMERLIGLPPAHYIDKKPSEVGHIHEEDREAVQRATREAWAHPGQPVPLDAVRVQRADGSWAYLENLYTALPEVPGVDGLVVHCREVTERVLAEKEILSSRQMLKLVLDSIPVRVFWKDHESVYLGCNAAFVRDSGLDSDRDVIGRSDFDMPWHHEAELYRKDDLAVFRSGEPKLQYEEPQTTGSGDLRWLRTSKVPLLNLEGKVVGIMGCYEDITQERASARALMESEENYRALIEGASELIYVVHETGEFVLANPLAARLLGHTPESIAGKHLDEVLGPERSAERLKLFRWAMEKHREYRGESVESTAEGERSYASSVKPLKNKEGRYDRVLIIAYDITEQKQSEKAVRESEARYRLLADNVNDVIWVIDMNLNLTYVSPSAETLVGYKPEELFRLPLSEFLNPEDLERIQKAVTEDGAREVNAQAGRGLPPTLELRVRHRDGHLLWTESTITLIRDASGNPAAIQGCTRDITRRKEIEEEKVTLEHQLLQSQKMEAVGTLAGGIAHDFNNLLTGVLGYANLLKLGSRPGEEVYEAADVIEKAADRAAQLTQQLLGFARKGKLREVSVDIHQTVQEVITLLARTLNKNIEISQRLGATACFVRGDPTQLQQVVLNLAVNARDAMPEGGRLLFKTENLIRGDDPEAEPAGLPPGEYLSLRVADSGHGIDPEIQDRIFEPFFTTKEQGKGTGMGLATVYGIVKNHGGHVQIDSSSSRGTTLCVILPVDRKAAPEVVSAESGGDGFRGSGRVLLIDDERVVRELATSMLIRLGYEVEAFASPREAIDYFKSHSTEIKLVLLDMIMPGMDGRECFETLTSIDSSVPVIVSSGYGLDGTIQEMFDRGLAGFIEKPFRLNALSNTLASTIKRSRKTRPKKDPAD